MMNLAPRITTVQGPFEDASSKTRRRSAGVWYRVPASAARELRRIAEKLRPLHLTAAILAGSR
jgi:hypothetical protein